MTGSSMKGFLLIGFSLIGGSTEIATQKKHVSNHKATLVLAHGCSGWTNHPGSECTYDLVLESQLPHKIVNLLFKITHQILS